MAQITDAEKKLKTINTDTIMGWKKGGLFAINLSQTSLTNWAAGGQNSAAVNGIFSAFASCSRIAEGEDTYQHLLEVDGVLPGFLRTNICVQQVDAFYEACDAAEGDGMYLDEDSRIRIW